MDNNLSMLGECVAGIGWILLRFALLVVGALLLAEWVGLI